MCVLDYEKPQQADGSNRAKVEVISEFGIGRRKPGFEAKGEKEGTRRRSEPRTRSRGGFLITVRPFDPFDRLIRRSKQE